jgi:hypothetical protein
MDRTISALAMVNTLAVDLPEFTFFFAFNLLCFVCVVTNCVIRLVANNLIVGRLYFCFMSLLCVFYQAPLVIFAQQLQESLENPWKYAFVIQSGAGLLLVYGALTKAFDSRFKAVPVPKELPRLYLITLLAALGALYTYLHRVPWQCTALHALLYDPWLTLLAREFGVKLIGTSVATYALGAYANSIAPALTLASIWLIGFFKGWSKAVGLIGLATGLFAIGAVLISGTKGLLIPLLIMLASGAYFWSRTWSSKLVAMGLSVCFVGASLIGFELFKERTSVVGAGYDFAYCSVRAGTCGKSIDMLRSMRFREDSLGIPSAFVKPIDERLNCLCGSDVSTEWCPSGTLNRVLTGTVSAAIDRQRFGSDTNEPNSVDLPGSTEKVLHRSATFAGAIFNRIFIVPFQVSVWHFMYSETESVDGMKTLPLARRLFGESINTAELVYQKYGTIYSGGDRTSTSTAPTSFFLSYPAYLGVFGFLLSILALICLDIILAKIAVLAGASLAPFLVGFVLTMSMNFITSDFITVLLSHGGLAGIALLLAYSILLRFRGAT